MEVDKMKGCLQLLKRFGIGFAIVFGILILILITEVSKDSPAKHPDSISNYPNTHWYCDELGLGLYVDSQGSVTASFDDDAIDVPYNVVESRFSKRFDNTLYFYLNDNSQDFVMMTCFYRNLANGEFSVTIKDWDTSIVDKDVTLKDYFYKFVLVD